ncbi:S-adenosyl-L-methionine-dependent methyltransferase [Phytophthora cactorum]|nr:S-adenosyl-L-methionine-dependent methyltransferase [Phytophthora cactorum]
MKSWSRSPAELAHRFNSLKRTFSADLSKFPPSFYTPWPYKSTKKPASKTSASTWPDLLYYEINMPPGGDRIAASPAVGGKTGCPGHRLCPACVIDHAIARRCDRNTHGIIAQHKQWRWGLLLSPERDLVSISQTSMSSEDVHHAVIALFEDISRQEVVYPPNAPHSNVGELLPTGISAFIGAVRQIGAITAGDVFTDIGSGVGNVVLNLCYPQRFGRVLVLKFDATWSIAAMLHWLKM